MRTTHDTRDPQPSWAPSTEARETGGLLAVLIGGVLVVLAAVVPALNSGTIAGSTGISLLGLFGMLLLHGLGLLNRTTLSTIVLLTCLAIVVGFNFEGIAAERPQRKHSVVAEVFVDRNGNGSYDGVDTVASGVVVVLRSDMGTQQIRQSDEIGRAYFVIPQHITDVTLAVCGVAQSHHLNLEDAVAQLASDREVFPRAHLVDVAIDRQSADGCQL